MAARKRNWQTSKTREKIRDSIKTGQLVKRFEEHALAITDEERERTKLTSSQLKAGETLLMRTLPTLSSAEIVETEREPGLPEALDQLSRLLGPELANILTQKDGLKELQKMMEKPEDIVIHEQPEQSQ